MANALTTLTHTLLAQMSLEAFTQALAPLRAFASSFGEADAGRGDKVKVAFVSAQDAAANFAGTYTVQDADMEGLDITLNNHKFVSWGLTDTEIANNPQVELERFARQKGFNLAKAVFQDVLSVVTAANYGAGAITAGGTSGDVLTSTAANFDTDDVIDIGVAADTTGWPEFERNLILLPAYYGAALKDADIKASDAFGSSEPIRQGRIPSALGFNWMKSPLIPANAENLVGMAVNPDAILVAMRYLAPQAGHDYASVARLTDPETGFTLGFREWYDNDTGTMKRVLESLYGFRVGNATGIKRIVSA